ncbi:hypothetical protein ACOME3_010174 [Neoechinorhynchus agilis]
MCSQFPSSDNVLSFFVGTHSVSLPNQVMLIVFKKDTGSVSIIRYPHEGEIKHITAHPTDSYLISTVSSLITNGTQSRPCRIWRTNDSKSLQIQSTFPHQNCLSLEFDSSGRSNAFVTCSNGAYLWDIDNEDVKMQITCEGILCGQWTASGNIVALNQRGLMRIFDSRIGSEMHCINGSSDSTVVLYDTHSHDLSADNVVKIYDDHEESVYGVDWSKNDSWNFASLSYDGKVSINTMPNKERHDTLLADYE